MSHGSERPLTINDLARYFRVSRRTVYRWMAAGTLPKPIYVANKAPRWPEAVLTSFLQEKTFLGCSPPR